MATATKTKLQNFIDGEFVDAADGATEEVTNPANGEAIAEMPLSNEEDVNRAVAAAKRAFDSWSTTTPGERARRLLKLADLIEEHAEEIADLESADAGKPRQAFLEDEIPFGATTCASSRAPGARCRARRQASTRGAAPRSSGASRWAWSARSRRGTTR